MLSLLLILCSLVLSCSTVSCCSVKFVAVVTKVDRNDEIDPELRNYIHSLNNQVIETVRRNDLVAGLDLFSDVVLEDEDKLRETTDMWPVIAEMVNGKDFTIYADYYWVSSGLGRSSCTIPPDDEDFTISIEAISDELFISLLETPGEVNNLMLGLVYALSDDEWKLYSLGIGSFKIANRSAPEWYTEAVALYDTGCLAQTALRLQVANSCIRPMPFMQYTNEDGITELTETVQSEINALYSFPIEVPEIDGRPLIYGIEPQFVQNTLLPKINYVTSLSFDNTESLEAEAHALVPEIERLFPCLTEGVDQIVFFAFMEPPVDPSRTYLRYGIPVELNQ